MKGNYYRKATNRAKWFVGTKHQHAKRFPQSENFLKKFSKSG